MQCPKAVFPPLPCLCLKVETSFTLMIYMILKILIFIKFCNMISKPWCPTWRKWFCCILNFSFSSCLFFILPRKILVNHNCSLCQFYFHSFLLFYFPQKIRRFPYFMFVLVLSPPPTSLDPSFFLHLRLLHVFVLLHLFISAFRVWLNQTSFTFQQSFFDSVLSHFYLLTIPTGKICC